MGDKFESVREVKYLIVDGRYCYKGDGIGFVFVYCIQIDRYGDSS